MQLDPNMAGLTCRFTPGQRVVCIFGGPWFDVGSPGVETCAGPAKGEIYVVADVLKSPTLLPGGRYVDDIYLRLEGMPLNELYHHLNFRPLRETSIDVFTALLNKTPTSEPITRREREEVR